MCAPQAAQQHIVPVGNAGMLPQLIQESSRSQEITGLLFQLCLSIKGDRAGVCQKEAAGNFLLELFVLLVGAVRQQILCFDAVQPLVILPMSRQC